jgi:2-keto-3-deoxy-L-rhamnonate aldolase RhmA
MLERNKRFEEFRRRVEAGEFVLGTGCSTASPVSVEILGYSGFDFVICDTEVLMVNPETLEDMIRAAEATGTIPVVKLKRNDPVMIQDALNAGAPACKVPHVTSADDLKRAIDAAYFAPRGHRGLCPVARANQYAQGRMSDLIEWTNRNVMIIPIIEDKEAVERIDEIMAVEGVSVYDIGPADLSNSYGLSPDLGFSNPQVDAAMVRITDSAKKYGKRVMTTPLFGAASPPELIRERIFDRGVSVLFYRSDASLVKEGIKQAFRLKELYK